MSLSDVLANVVNEVFDLGYAEQDIQFGVIFRNRKILNSCLPQVISRHRKLIRYDEFATRRNDIVHRGKLDDAELIEVRSAVLAAVVMRTIRVDSSDSAAIAAATREAAAEVGAAAQMRDLLKQKKEQFAQHLAATRAMLGELALPLIDRIKAQPPVTA